MAPQQTDTPPPEGPVCSTPERPGHRALRLGLIAFGTGLLSDWLLYYLIRVQNTKVLIGYALPVVLCTALAGVVIGGLRASGARRQPVGGTLLALSALAFAAAAVFHQGVPTYYPRFADLPPARPDPLWPYPVALVTSVLAAIAPFAIVAERYAKSLVMAARPARLTALHLLGFGVGGIMAWLSIEPLGGYLGLLLGVAGALCCVDGTRRRTLALGAMLCLMVWSSVRAPQPFMWSLQNGRIVESTWSSYNKLDFVAFDGIEGDEDCIASVYNDTMMYYTCPHGNEDHYQRIQFWKALLPSRTKLMIIGSSGGMAALSALDYNPGLERVVGIEIDPIVVDRFSTSFKAYNGGVFHKPIVEIHAAEGRAMMHRFAETGERFDLVYFDGVDQRIYSFWQSGVPVENYLFTEEGISLALDDLLTDNGVLLLDVGGVDQDGVQYYLDSMPEGAHATLAWYAVSSYPMVGLPLFLIVMSRNPAAVAQVATAFKAIPSIETVPTLDERRGPPATDDRPFPPRPDVLEWPLLLLILSFALGLPLLQAARKRLAAHPVGEVGQAGSLRPIVGLLVLGIGGGLVQSVLVSRLARAFEGPALGAAVIVAVFLVGGALAGLIAVWLGPRRSGVPLVFSALAIATGATAISAGMTGAAVPSLLQSCSLALATGLGSAALWPVALERIPREARAPWFALESLGYLWGIALCQVTLLFLGYRATGMLAMGLLAAATLMLLAWVKGGSDAPVEG